MRRVFYAGDGDFDTVAGKHDLNAVRDADIACSFRVKDVIVQS